MIDSICTIALLLSSGNFTCKVAPRDTYLGDLRVTSTSLGVSTIYALALNLEGKILACMSNLGTYLFSFPEGKLLHQLTSRDGRPLVIGFSRDGKYLIGAMPGLRLWDTATGKLQLSEKWDWEEDLFKLPMFYDPYNNPISPPRISPDTKYAYFASKNKELRVIEIARAKEIKQINLKETPFSIDVSADGKNLAITTFETVILYRADTLAEQLRIDMPKAINFHHYKTYYLDNGETMLVMGPSGDGGQRRDQVMG